MYINNCTSANTQKRICALLQNRLSCTIAWEFSLQEFASLSDRVLAVTKLSGVVAMVANVSADDHNKTLTFLNVVYLAFLN